MKKKEDFNLWALKLKIGEIIKTIQRKKGEELVKVEDVEGVGGNVYSEDYLINIGNETFLRSTIRFTLSYLHDQDLDRYLENIRSLLTTTEVDDYWKNVTIGFIANLQNVSENERGLFEELLNGDSDLQKYFFDSVIEQKNPYWYTIWKDTLFDQWSSDGEFKHSVLFTDYIKKSVEWLS